MSVQQSYNEWAQQYDSNVNLTRDLKAIALQNLLEHTDFKNVLEIGCGTGKNTAWLSSIAEHIIAADLSQEMIRKAKEKIKEKHVEFLQFDMLTKWNFTEAPFDLITFSLVVEHIDNISMIIKKAATFLLPGGRICISELHPFKQYNGSQAKFITDKGTHLLDCFTHQVSDYVQPAIDQGLVLEKCSEWFDEGIRLPRLLAIRFCKL